MPKQYTNVYSTLGASNHAAEKRAELDLYCTSPKAVEKLLKLERFSKRIWEPCDGLGHISDTLAARGYEVRQSDIVTRGRDIEQLDFLTCNEKWDGSIITTPPYSHVLPIIHKAIQLVDDGCKVAMWLRTLFPESEAQKKFFMQYPPKRIWISSSRVGCGKNEKPGKGSPQNYMWVIWQKGYKSETIVNWF